MGLGSFVAVFRRGLASEGSVAVLVVVPLLEFLVEQAGVVFDDAVDEPVELVGVDAVPAFHFSIEPGRGRPNVDVANALVNDVPKLDWNSAPLSVWTFST